MGTDEPRCHPDWPVRPSQATLYGARPAAFTACSGVDSLNLCQPRISRLVSENPA